MMRMIGYQLMIASLVLWQGRRSLKQRQTVGDGIRFTSAIGILVISPEPPPFCHVQKVAGQGRNQCEEMEVIGSQKAPSHKDNKMANGHAKMSDD